MKSIFDQLTTCWYRYPAFFYGLASLMGAYMALFPISFVFIGLWALAMIWPALTWKISSIHWRIGLALGIVLAVFCLTSTRYLFPKEMSVKGLAKIEIASIGLTKSNFGQTWNYQGTLLSFISDKGSGEIARNIPIRFFWPIDRERPLATHTYWAKGRLKTNEQGFHTFIPEKQIPWQPEKKVLEVAEWRMKAKTALHQHIKNHINDPHVAAFMSGIAAGNLDDRQLSMELSRFGLQHLMAISGLHFSLLASFFGFLLCCFLPKKGAAIGVILLLSAYFVFLGSSPSVWRAWIAITVAMCGIYFGKRSQALNSLGIALLLIVLWNPLWIQSIGFQFSFAITTSILVWYEPCETLLQKVFPKRNLSQIADLHWWDQHGYCLLCFLRQGLALTLAVNLVALPMTLFYFQKFPVMSLIYNLFYPFLVSFSLLLLFLAIAAGPLGWISQFLHGFNEIYTRYLLDLTFNLPKAFDFTWYIDEVAPEFLLIYLVAVFFLGLALKAKAPSEELSFL